MDAPVHFCHIARTMNHPGVGIPIRVSVLHTLATATICLGCSSITDRSRSGHRSSGLPTWST